MHCWCESPGVAVAQCVCILTLREPVSARSCCNRRCINCTNLSFLENTLKWICIFVGGFNNIASTTFLIRDEWEEPQLVFGRAGRSVCIYIEFYQAPHISWGLPLLWVGTIYSGAAVSHPSAAGGMDGHWLQTKQNSQNSRLIWASWLLSCPSRNVLFLLPLSM